ncbi:MAG: DUF3572 domain-containing protein [Planktomarina sp.]
MSPNSAETLALQALAWIIGNDDLRGVFMGASGLTEADVKEQAGQAEFLVSVLDFLCMDDAWVMAFCDAHGVAYTLPMQARAALPGGADMHWT